VFKVLRVHKASKASRAIRDIFRQRSQ
jgi:hypothetical protein